MITYKYDIVVIWAWFAVIYTDLNLDSLQGDKMILDYLAAMGAKIDVVSDGIKVIGDNLSAIKVDASQCPDVIPVLSVALALANGKSEVVNARRLRIKECDRIVATTTQINQIGGKVQELDEGMIINGVKEFDGGNCKSFADHRIAMMLAIAVTRCNKPIILDNMECVEKSYPSFWQDYQSLGGIIDVIDMEK